MNLLNLLPKDQQDAIFSQELVDIEPEFLGFINIRFAAHS